MKIEDILKTDKINDKTIKNFFENIIRQNIDVSPDFVSEVLGYVKNKKLLLDIISKYNGNMSLYLVTYLNKIHDDKLKLSYMDKAGSSLSKLIIAASMDLDDNKIKAIPYLNDDELERLGYYVTEEDCKVKIIDKIENDSNKMNLYATLDSDSFRIRVIDNYKKKKNYDKNILKKMILGLDGLNIRRSYIKKNLDIKSLIPYQVGIMENHDVYDAGLDALPNDLTFGIEIEAEGGKADIIKGLGGYLDDWKVKNEVSLPNGVELTSPILHYTYKDLNSIYEICNLARDNGLVTTDYCGGHIHFGEQYLDSIDAYKWLYYLYANMEDVFLLISNPKYEKPRDAINDFAIPIKNRYLNYMKNPKKPYSFENYIRILKEEFDGRFRDLKLAYVTPHPVKEASQEEEPYGTIEFRGPNGQLPTKKTKDKYADYGAKNIILDILLYGNLIVKANQLSHLPMTESLDKLINTLDKSSDDKRVDLLLKLLFKEPKLRREFKNRYEINKQYKENLNIPKENVTIDKMIPKRR